MKSSAGLKPQRSATAAYPGGLAPLKPSVAVVVPARNEAAHLENLIRDIQAQDYPNLCEIWIVDGGSTDASLAILHRACETDARLRVLDNPRRLPAAALNIVLGTIQVDVLMRLDAHARYASDVVSQSVNALLSTGAGGVGSIARPVPGRSQVARAIVAAHRSRLGVGVAFFRRETSGCWVDSVWNGCYWRHILDEAGPLREDLPRVEDNDLHQRIRALGYGLYLEPKISAVYYPRSTISSLAAQYFATGLGCGRALVEAPRALSYRHVAPAALVLGLSLGVLLAAFWPKMWPLAAAILVVYLFALAVAVGIELRRGPIAQALLLAPVLAALHLSYGAGTLLGLVRQRWGG